MRPHRDLQPADWQGLARLAGDGVSGTSRLVEQLHLTITSISAPVGPAVQGPTGGITGLVYRSVRGVNALVGATVDTVAGRLVPRLPARGSSFAREQWLAALNGVLGDHLAKTDNPLAIPMTFRHEGSPLALESNALARAFETPRRRLLIAAHGLCMNDLHWALDRDEAGARGPGIPDRLARRLGLSPLYLHYNSGRPIADNGADFAELLETLVEQWPVPVEEIVIVGHSMGGLITRSALELGRAENHGWVKPVSGVAFLGTPHQGSPVERAGHRFERLLGFSPYSAPFNRLGGLRSAGITDLRHGLTHSAGELASLRCLAVAATTRSGLAPLERALGDGLVPVDSALGRHEESGTALPIAESDRHIVPGVGHFGLLHAPQVYRLLYRWLR